MKLIHIVGRQNNGKTTLIVELIAELKKRGLQIGTLKHSSHKHELDKPGKDSFLHREAGGYPAAVATANQIAVFIPREPGENPFDKLAPLYDGKDVVIIEGYISGPGKKIEVWRKEVGTRPIFMERNDIEALITDDNVDADIPVWPRNDIAKIADNIMELLSGNS